MRGATDRGEVFVPLRIQDTPPPGVSDEASNRLRGFDGDNRGWRGAACVFAVSGPVDAAALRLVLGYLGRRA